MQASTAAAAAGLFLSIAIASAGCGDHDAAPPAAGAAGNATPAEPVAIRVAPVSADGIDETVEVVGTLYGEQEAQIASKSTGRIVELFADLGDRLDQGQPIAQVDPTDYQLAVRQRELALQEALAKLGLERVPDESFDVGNVATVRRADVQQQNAKARLDRARQLYEQRPPLISEQDFADTQTQFDVAKQDLDVARLEAGAALAAAKSRGAELAEARQQLADTTLRAPGNAGEGAKGRWAVAERRASIGEFVQPGTVTFKLISDQPILLRAAVPERHLNRVRQDQQVTLRVDALAKPVTGKISRVSPAVDVASRTFNVEATFANAERSLSAGAFGRGTIVVGRRGNVLSVPPAALYSFAGLDKVFTVRDGKAVAHAVQVIERTKDRVVIEDTLKGAAEDGVAIEGLSRLATGVPVKVREGTPAATRATR
jgi:RND family efflux transporter MFP subunit